MSLAIAGTIPGGSEESERNAQQYADLLAEDGISFAEQLSYQLDPGFFLHECYTGQRRAASSARLSGGGPSRPRR